MKTRKKIGYVVIQENGLPMRMGIDGLLYTSNRASLFKKIETAKELIKNSKLEFPRFFESFHVYIIKVEEL
jgi:hypothetical protein